MQAAANSPGAFLCSSQSCEIATAPAEPRNDKSGSLPHPEGRNDKARSAPLPCHCEEGVSPTWQSQAGTYESAGAFLCSSQACEIATAPAEPRNDKSGSPPHLRPRAAERTKKRRGCGAQTVGKASQSLRPQAQRKWKSFSPAACTSEKIPLGLQTCEGRALRALQRAAAPFKREPSETGLV